MLCVMMLPLINVVSLHIKAVYQSVREATTASGVDNAASPRRQTPLRTGIISPTRERLITMQKQLEEPRKYNVRRYR